MKKILTIAVAIIAILAAIISRNFWLPAVRQYWTTHLPHAKTTAAAQSLPSTGLDSLNDTFALLGNTYYLYRIEKIPSGWMAYYSPSLKQDPDNADSSVSVAYYPFGETTSASAEMVASSIEQLAEQRGLTPVKPFSFPDPDYQGQSIYAVPMYIVYPQDKVAEIFILVAKQDNNNAFSVEFTRNFKGTTTTAITKAAQNWLSDNMQTYVTALAKTQAGDLWFEK
jgi:hypothetical protein